MIKLVEMKYTKRMKKAYIMLVIGMVLVQVGIVVFETNEVVSYSLLGIAVITLMCSLVLMKKSEV